MATKKVMGVIPKAKLSPKASKSVQSRWATFLAEEKKAARERAARKKAIEKRRLKRQEKIDKANLTSRPTNVAPGDMFLVKKTIYLILSKPEATFAQPYFGKEYRNRFRPPQKKINWKIKLIAFGKRGQKTLSKVFSEKYLSTLEVLGKESCRCTACNGTGKVSLKTKQSLSQPKSEAELLKEAKEMVKSISLSGQPPPPPLPPSANLSGLENL